MAPNPLSVNSLNTLTLPVSCTPSLTVMVAGTQLTGSWLTANGSWNGSISPYVSREGSRGLALQDEPLRFREFLGSLATWMLLRHPQAFREIDTARLEIVRNGLFPVTFSTLASAHSSYPLKDLYADFAMTAPEDAPLLLASRPEGMCTSKHVVALYLLETGGPS